MGAFLSSGPVEYSLYYDLAVLCSWPFTMHEAPVPGQSDYMYHTFKYHNPALCCCGTPESRKPSNAVMNDNILKEANGIMFKVKKDTRDPVDIVCRPMELVPEYTGQDLSKIDYILPVCDIMSSYNDTGLTFRDHNTNMCHNLEFLTTEKPGFLDMIKLADVDGFTVDIQYGPSFNVVKCRHRLTGQYMSYQEMQNRFGKYVTPKLDISLQTKSDLRTLKKPVLITFTDSKMAIVYPPGSRVSMYYDQWQEQVVSQVLTDAYLYYDMHANDIDDETFFSGFSKQMNTLVKHALSFMWYRKLNADDKNANMHVRNEVLEKLPFVKHKIIRDFSHLSLY